MAAPNSAKRGGRLRKDGVKRNGRITRPFQVEKKKDQNFARLLRPMRFLPRIQLYRWR